MSSRHAASISRIFCVKGKQFREPWILLRDAGEIGGNMQTNACHTAAKGVHHARCPFYKDPNRPDSAEQDAERDREERGTFPSVFGWVS